MCNVNEDLSVDITLPEDFSSDKEIKVYTHGFSADVSGAAVYVKAWIEAHDVNVILVEWKNLAFAGQITDWDSYSYDSAARNSIDIGEYLGHCIYSLTKTKGIDPSTLHLTGHSLGAHLMCKAGRQFRDLKGEKLGRISGLDPAGPRFIDGPIMSAIPELHENPLNHESASFVDIIHTDGSFTPAAVWVKPRLGDLNQLGHMDFYPVGGEEQPGCTLGGPDALPFSVCSHNRAMYYFFHSIREKNLFPSQVCINVTSCNQDEIVSDDIIAYMGDLSQVSSVFIQSLKKYLGYDVFNIYISF